MNFGVARLQSMRDVEIDADDRRDQEHPGADTPVPLGLIHRAPEVPGLAGVGEHGDAELRAVQDRRERDAHLRSGDFFDVETYPTLTFKSDSVTSRGGGHFDVAGTLTIRGTSKAITIPVTYLGTARDPWGRERAAFEAEVTLNRKDFGLNWNAALETGGFLVGDEVRVSLSIQAVAQ